MSDKPDEHQRLTSAPEGVSITTCQCQNCIYCHGGGCGDKPDFVIRFKQHNRQAEVAVCEMCGASLLGTHSNIFEKVRTRSVARPAPEGAVAARIALIKERHRLIMTVHRSGEAELHSQAQAKLLAHDLPWLCAALEASEASLSDAQTEIDALKERNAELEHGLTVAREALEAAKWEMHCLGRDLQEIQDGERTFPTAMLNPETMEMVDAALTLLEEK